MPLHEGCMGIEPCPARNTPHTMWAKIESTYHYTYHIKRVQDRQYTAYHVGKDGTPYYYTYHITEDAIDGYTTEITYQGEHQYNITVINRKKWFEQCSYRKRAAAGVRLDLRE